MSTYTAYGFWAFIFSDSLEQIIAYRKVRRDRVDRTNDESRPMVSGHYKSEEDEFEADAIIKTSN
jgi:hypothetical protein